MIEGTKRKCSGGDHQVVYNSSVGWHHISREDWVDHPHKAAPRKYKRVKSNVVHEEGRDSQEPEEACSV